MSERSIAHLREWLKEKISWLEQHTTNEERLASGAYSDAWRDAYDYALDVLPAGLATSILGPMPRAYVGSQGGEEIAALKRLVKHVGRRQVAKGARGRRAK